MKYSNLPYWTDAIQMTECLPAAINREINNQEGYVIWNIYTSMHLSVDSDVLVVVWDEDDFSLLSEDDIIGIQELLLAPDPDNMPSTARKIRLYANLTKIREYILVVPCVMYEGELPKLDFLKAYQFDWSKDQMRGYWD